MGYGDVGGNQSVRWEMFMDGSAGPKRAEIFKTERKGRRQKGGDETAKSEPRGVTDPSQKWRADGFQISLRPPFDPELGRKMTPAELIAHLLSPNVLHENPEDGRVEFYFPIEDNDESNFDQISIRWGVLRVPKTRRPAAAPVEPPTVVEPG